MRQPARLPRDTRLLLGARAARSVGQGALIVGFALYLDALGWGRTDHRRAVYRRAVDRRRAGHAVRAAERSLRAQTDTAFQSFLPGALAYRPLFALALLGSIVCLLLLLRAHDQRMSASVCHGHIYFYPRAFKTHDPGLR